MLTDREGRVAHLNSLVGKPYRLGAAGPDCFDCYGISRHLQREFFGRDCPLFEMPGQAGRIAIASAIALHPFRSKWVEVQGPADGCAVSMAKQDIGYHLGTYLSLDGGIIVHAVEDSGVTVDTIFAMKAMGWRRFRFLAPA
jgi:hypothetical protein